MTIIVGMALPAFTTSTKRKKLYREKEKLNALKEASENYFEDTFQFPLGLDDLVSDAHHASGWTGPYYTPGLALYGGQGAPDMKDEWGEDYLFQQTPPSKLVIRSRGPDLVLNTGDDLTVTADVTFIRRQVTLDELSVINAAILAYNKVYIGSDPLLPSWPSILSKLRAKGFLPSGTTTYDRDGWNTPYVPDPLGVSPVVRVTSGNL